MNKPESQDTGMVTSVGQVGVDHEASFHRSYWNQPQVYTQASQLEADWQHFYSESQRRQRRRTMMRTLVTPAVLNQANVPFEAALPYEDVYLTYLGQNSHPSVSRVQDPTLPSVESGLIQLPTGYQLDDVATPADVEPLTDLWTQFGWTRQGVETLVEAGTTPLVLIRNLEQQVVAVMIAESLEFGELRLVELTEMAVTPSERGHGLASVLIHELSQLSLARFGPTAL
ncbi:MAG TPA: hypothetical protein VF209_05240 [Patescibacteria group bacterium]